MGLRLIRSLSAVWLKINRDINRQTCSRAAEASLRNKKLKQQSKVNKF